MSIHHHIIEPQRPPDKSKPFDTPPAFSYPIGEPEKLHGGWTLDVLVGEREALEVRVEDLRRVCDPEDLDFETTEEVTPLEGTVGQHRAVAAIQFGLRVRTQGYNIFVAGVPGSGRNTTARAHLHQIAKSRDVPPDWCYVHNFFDPNRPKAISLPAGTSRDFARDMSELIADCQRDIPKAFEGEEYDRQKKRVTRELQTERDAIIVELQQAATERGFALQMTASGMVTVPVLNGHPASQEEFDSLPDEAKQKVQVAGEALNEAMAQALARGRKLDKEASERVRVLDGQVALSAVGHLFDEVTKKYDHSYGVVEHLKEVRDAIFADLPDFVSGEKRPDGASPNPESSVEDRLSRFGVNVVVTNSGPGAPVVVEHNPSYHNLFGRIDYRTRAGTVVSDFTTVKAGSIHRANGGYLVLQARDLLSNPLAWEALKRTLKSHFARIENVAEQYSPFPSPSLKPDAIQLDVKIVLVGHPSLYYLLYHQDEDFRKLFKVKADFAPDMERTADHVSKYAAFISSRCRDVGLRHFHRTAVAKVVEYGGRQLEHQGKLSTRFIDIADLVDEASFWAGEENANYVLARHVEQAIAQKEYRSNLVEERLQEMIEDGTIMIDTSGEVVGQINGLSILDMGDHSFGRPSRITARTYLGSAGVVNIERETKQSGRIHTKGVLILAAYLAGKYAQERQLSLSTSLTFEQLYEDVDGDSASSAELYALLSSLSGLPIKQSFAVTGSINQRGEIQAIGGVTRKIEGFFAVCKSKGLTGDQGVIIPASNVKHLMLNDEVVAAVKEGKFRIYAVRAVDEGIALLTGADAGEPDADGGYAPGTVHYLVQQKLNSYAEKLRGSKNDSKNKEDEPAKPENGESGSLS